MRILVAGRPRCGKTLAALSLSRQHKAPLRSTDDLIKGSEWSEASEKASLWLDEPGPWVIEGVAVVRALRKWLARHPPPGDGLPFDEMHWYRKLKCASTKGQNVLGKACETVWREIRPEVVRRLQRVGKAEDLLHEEGEA